MEVDFDKEIDAILRKAQRDGPVLIGDFSSSPHLDADSISAFAENAMPEKSRALYTRHLADCDRCRKVLSNLLAMNAEAVPATASPSVITIAERASEPWYRRLFIFPNLAYVMGGLVLIFAGFLGYSVLRNMSTNSTAEVSQVSEDESTRGGPRAESEPVFGMAANTMSNMAANSAANTNASGLPLGGMTAANTTNSNSLIAKEQSRGYGAPLAEAPATNSNFAADGLVTTDVARPAAAAAPPASATQPAPKDARERADADAKVAAKTEDKAGGFNVQEPAKNDLSINQRQITNLPTQSGPMNSNERQYNKQLENLDRKSRAALSKKSAERDEESSVGRKTVSGKTFERKQGVWYDVNYQGRPTINVRRGSDEFNRLDAGLRSIANSMSGTVVVVWGAKAYRIQ